MRFFGEDAVIAARVLNIFAHKDHNFMVASIPTHRCIYHCRKLIESGQKVLLCNGIQYVILTCKQVAIVRQVDTAAMRKAQKVSSSSTFDRSVAGIFTIGGLFHCNFHN